MELPWRGRPGWWVVLALAVGIALGAAGTTLAGWSHPAPIVVELPPEPTPIVWHVYVTGAVARPGVYRLTPGAIAADALDAAGGATDGAALSRVNLARSLGDGDQLHVPPAEPDPTGAPPAGSPAHPIMAPGVAGPLDLNRATAEQLQALPGIGPATAAGIVRYRESNGPFASKEAIMDVPGIGPAKYEQIQELVTVD